MKSHSNSEIVRIVVNRVAADQIVAAGAGLIGNKNSSRIILAFIANDLRMIHTDEVNSLATIIAFIGLEGGNSRTFPATDVECLVVVEHMVIDDRDVGGIRDKDAFKICIAN